MMHRRLLHLAVAALAFAPAGVAGASSADDQPAAAARITVIVLGAVTKPGRIVLPTGAHLSDAIAAAMPSAPPATNAMQQSIDAYAGDACGVHRADVHRVVLTRKDDTGKNISYQVDMSRAARAKAVANDPALVDADLIYVPECRMTPVIVGKQVAATSG
ncbi:MAG: hypothetical protein JOZ24_02825 [Candidatus Eremiobacteraeota bacterium]|nr:hypothetical protein [Candidatus Eremiobacteraeota bacterium]